MSKIFAMNIHFDDKNLFEKLKRASIVNVLVGSHMYGTSTENSDTDLLYIYATSQNELLSPFDSHHQLQYKEEGVDHNFVSLHSFIKNALSGDSTINFEVIYSGSLAETPLYWLYENREIFLTYNIIRSYIGFCRRDLNSYGRYKTDKERYKRFGHILRGSIYTEAMLRNEFDFTKCNEETLSEMLKNEYDSGKRLKELTALTTRLRTELTHANDFNTLGLGKTIKVADGIKLHEWCIGFCKGDLFMDYQNVLEDFDMNRFIDSVENWVSY